ncbi:hypothetical protein [Nocardiopsis sp. ATB16-24]|uniref:hypothetical protein n=1 Tax=Nocardiopsis sp. ATB16-24 TaxID=3019555 RepID=UPI002556C80B|nr:hypothetical protein [Nocardiopsis sp. ATB16-24]
MISLMNRWASRITVLACTALASPLLLASTAEAASTSVLYLCEASRDGERLSYESTRTWEVSAPDEVAPGSTFSLSFTPEAFFLNHEYQQEVRDVTVSVLLPSDTELVSVELSGGRDLEGSVQSVEVTGERVDLTASGPFYGGESFELPTIIAAVTAPSTGELTSSPAGTGFENPGIELWSLDPATQQFSPARCYPDSAQPVTLSTTTVSY